MTVKQILYSLQNCSLGQSAARAPTLATPHHPQFPHKMRRRHLESVSSRSLSVRGSWGTAPSLYAQKERPGGEPYRLCTLHILRDAFRRPQIIPCRVGIQILISKRPRPAARRLPTWSRISSAAHSSANRSPAPARRDPSPSQNIIIIPSLTSPIKPTIYAILAQ